jgi:hypothetical protein
VTSFWHRCEGTHHLATAPRHQAELTVFKLSMRDG